MTLLALTLFSLLSAAMAEPPPGVNAKAIETLIERGQSSRQAYDNLEVLCDDIGPRLAGTPALDRAINWASGVLTEAGLSNVHTEPVMVPVWIRGTEHASVITPNPWALSMLGLGGSVGTPPEGLTAEVLVVSSFEELQQRKTEAEGRIVLFDVPFSGYKDTVAYRTGGANAAARAGAVAALVRSVTPVSLDTPHTGAMHYDEDVRKIPTAAITIENATRIHRLTERGQTVTVTLTMGAHSGPDAPSANVIAEVKGRQAPDEIVLLA
ncbi:MAG TPA: peptidase M28 family protein, partial [Planctomycetes bacterium]|nr:peptidase M28 family protein [Planctomycetota bacterium]